MLTKVRKWGNSLGLRIPKSFASAASVEAGSTLDIAIEEGNLVIRSVRRPSYSLLELVNGIDEDDLHDEVSTGEAQGREVW